MCKYCEPTRHKEIPYGCFDEVLVTTRSVPIENSIGNCLNVRVEENCLNIEYSAYSCDSSFYIDIPIKYCPMCGRELKIKEK